MLQKGPAHFSGQRPAGNNSHITLDLCRFDPVSGQAWYSGPVSNRLDKLMADNKTELLRKAAKYYWYSRTIEMVQTGLFKGWMLEKKRATISLMAVLLVQQAFTFLDNAVSSE
jgi:hypothetical protein